jgi:hypothetical protein
MLPLQHWDSVRSCGLLAAAIKLHLSKPHIILIVFCAEMMKNVNTVQYDELSPEQIAAARQRRSQDRCNWNTFLLLAQSPEGWDDGCISIFE